MQLKGKKNKTLSYKVFGGLINSDHSADRNQKFLHYSDAKKRWAADLIKHFTMSNIIS